MSETINSIQSPDLQTRAMFSSETINETEGTVEVIFGSELPVRMYNHEIGNFMEVMSFEEGHVRWDRLTGGAPVLDNHNSLNGTKGVLGIVERAWADGDLGRAILKFDLGEGSDGAEAFRKIKAGILKGISFGYRVFKYEKTEDEEGQLPTLRAVDWEATEISLAPIQADATAKIRKEEEKLASVEIIDLSLQTNRTISTEIKKNKKMPELEGKRLAELELANKRSLEAAQALTDEKTRAANEAAVVKSERTRISSINDMCRKFSVEATTVSEYIDNGTSADAVRAILVDSFEQADPNEGTRAAAPSISFKEGGDETDKHRNAAVESLVMRVSPNTEDKDGGSSFRVMDLKGLASDCLERNGISTRGLTSTEVFKAAVNGQRSGAMGTSDFSNILGNAINRQLTKAYSETERTFTSWASRGVAKDFREMNRVSLSGMVEEFKEVKEGGEYESATLTDGVESYKVAKFGRIIPFSWEAMVNDDLSALKRLPQAIANKAAQKQSDLVYAILTGNPLMADGTALFDASHGKLGTNGDISDTTLAEMKKLMRNQKSASNDFINVSPQTLIVGAEMENLALKFMNSNFSPTTVGDQNIYKGIMNVVVEPRISNTDWFAAASPAAIDTVEYSFLEGEGELHTEQEQGFNVDGVQTKARMTFGAKALDHRGLFKNPNA